MSYVDQAVRQPPKTMTHEEQRRLLKTTGEHVAGFRDHVLFSLALGTALREHEIVALNVGDVSEDGIGIRRRFPLRVFKRSNQDANAQEAILPDALRYKLEKFLRWKKQQGEELGTSAPLFVSRRNSRLSTRRVRSAFVSWQRKARLERRFTFHALRHTALTNLYQSTKDIRLVQRFARHRSVLSTTIYAQASDEELLRAARALPC